MRVTGLFDFLKPKEPKGKYTYAKMLNGQTPIFTQFGSNIYASDVVQQAISCITKEISKLSPTHIKSKDGIDDVSVSGSVQNVLNMPNELMSMCDLLEKVTWNLFFNYNAFVLPIWQGNTLAGLYPLQPINVDILQDGTEKLYIKFRFRNGMEYTIRYSDVIHIRWNYSVNDIMGGNDFGQPDHSALLNTLQLNDTLLKGIAKSLNSSYAVNGVVKYNTLMDEGQTEKALQEMQTRLNNSESGFLALDMKAEYIPITRSNQLVDEKTLKFVDEKILRHFGVPLPILTGDYTKEQYDAFYQKTLEPIIIKLGQAFTKGIFTSHEINGYRNKIVFYSKELIFMDVSQKLELVRLLGDTGTMFENEKRVAFGLKPLEELEGKRKQSLNYVDVEYIREYQLWQAKKSKEGVKTDE